MSTRDLLKRLQAFGEVSNKGTYKFTVFVETTDGYSQMQKLLESLRQHTAEGSGTEVMVKTGGGEEKFYFDGDGPVKVDFEDHGQAGGE
jgi:hypothetical protein